MTDKPNPDDTAKKLVEFLSKKFPMLSPRDALAQIDAQLKDMAQSLPRVVAALRADDKQETKQPDFSIGKPLDGDIVLPAGAVNLGHIQQLEGYKQLQAACDAQALNVKLEVMVQDSRAPGYTKGFPRLQFKAAQQPVKNFLIGVVRISLNKPYSESRLIVNFRELPPTPPPAQPPAPKP